MTNVFILGAMILLASQFSSAVILRPKWYPYFQRENQASSSGSSGSGQSALSAETLTRQARSQDSEITSFCPDGPLNEDCLNKIVMVVSKILQLSNQRYTLY